MKGLRKLVDNVKPNFVKGGKFAFLESTFDAFETFLFVPNHTTSKGAHIRDCNDMKRTMIVVVLALMPALFFGFYNTGFHHFVSQGVTPEFLPSIWFGFLKVLPMIVVSYAVGLGIEFAYAQSRHHEVSEGFLVSGMLIPMIMPVDMPLWMIALSTAFAVVFGKEIFGGSGMNVVNPAILARAFAFFSYTPSISGDKVWIAGMTEGTGVVDGFSGATPLELLSTTGTMGQYSVMDAFVGLIPGSVGETSFIAILLGAAVLLFTGVASWRTMLSVFVGGILMALVINLVGVVQFMGISEDNTFSAGLSLLCSGELSSVIGGNPYMGVPAYVHIITGGFAFGAVFMATDPVTSAQTNTGKYIVGFMTGLFAVLVRAINPAYPEGMMLAIIFMNMLAPLVDYYVVEANISRRKKRVKLAK